MTRIVRVVRVLRVVRDLGPRGWLAVALAKMSDGTVRQVTIPIPKR